MGFTGLNLLLDALVNILVPAARTLAKKLYLGIGSRCAQSKGQISIDTNLQLIYQTC